jgi:hypothetical protein
MKRERHQREQPPPDSILSAASDGLQSQNWHVESGSRRLHHRVVPRRLSRRFGRAAVPAVPQTQGSIVRVKGMVVGFQVGGREVPSGRGRVAL